MKLLYPFVWLIKKTKVLSAVSMRLVQLTGKSKYAIHPKHLINIEPLWYLADINRQDVVLDLGCHNGQHTLKTAVKCRKIIGLDYDRKQLTIARNSAADKHITNVVFRQFNLEQKLKFKDQSFDKILCLDVLEHIIRRNQLLASIRRLLKPRGLAFIAIPNLNTSWKQLQKKVGLNPFADPDHKIEYSLAQAKNILKRAGFDIISLRAVTYDSPWIGFIDLLGGLSLRLYSKIALYKKAKAGQNINESTGFRIVIKKSL
ncbi:MAG: class I SAM-dependent methyltransferase [Candidatus Beckwithbacteria bacterium]|nr:class I SAM-dependent methyltransferase [Candidatus Beckwithbacteria bacterium]